MQFFSKKLTLIILLFTFSISAQGQSIVSVCSWNLKNFGKSKTDQEIEIIANTVRSFDVVAIQEVVAGYGGSQAVARLHDALNRKGAKWEYVISEATSSSPYRSEKYAYLWKSSKLKKVGEAWLEMEYSHLIEREPYFIRFNSNGKHFTLVSFHALPKAKQPETEIKYFKYFDGIYPTENLLFCGDFNLPSTHSVFNPLKKMGYAPALQGMKTSLRQKCINGDCLASELDNFFYNEAKFQYLKSGIIPFFEDFPTLKEARLLSDHVPIFFNFVLN